MRKTTLSSFETKYPYCTCVRNMLGQGRLAAEISVAVRQKFDVVRAIKRVAETTDQSSTAILIKTPGFGHHCCCSCFGMLSFPFFW